MTLVAGKEWQTAAPLVWVYSPTGGKQWTNEMARGLRGVLGWNLGFLCNHNYVIILYENSTIWI